MAYIRTTKQFISRLKQARIDKGLTQSDLGKMVGMTQKKIAMIETLKASPRLDVLLVISAALDLNISIDGEEDQTEKKINLVWS